MVRGLDKKILGMDFHNIISPTSCWSIQTSGRGRGNVGRELRVFRMRPLDRLADQFGTEAQCYIYLSVIFVEGRFHTLSIMRDEALSYSSAPGGSEGTTVLKLVGAVDDYDDVWIPG